MCDDHSCGAVVIEKADIRSPANLNANREELLGKLVKSGWQIGLDRQLCGYHRELIQEETRQRVLKIREANERARQQAEAQALTQISKKEEKAGRTSDKIVELPVLN